MKLTTVISLFLLTLSTFVNAGYYYQCTGQGGESLRFHEHNKAGLPILAFENGLADSEEIKIKLTGFDYTKDASRAFKINLPIFQEFYTKISVTLPIPADNNTKVKASVSLIFNGGRTDLSDMTCYVSQGQS